MSGEDFFRVFPKIRPIFVCYYQEAKTHVENSQKTQKAYNDIKESDKLVWPNSALNQLFPLLKRVVNVEYFSEEEESEHVEFAGSEGIH